MTDRDLTPAEARAEVEAFMGEGFACLSFEGLAGYDAVAHFGGNLTVRGTGPTYRAAVDALKAAWRDAVRPWVEDARDAALTYPWESNESLDSRVLKEDSNGCSEREV